MTSRGQALRLGDNSYLVEADGAESKREDVCARFNMVLNKSVTCRRVLNTVAWDFDHDLTSPNGPFNHKRNRKSWFRAPDCQRPRAEARSLA